MSNDMERNFYFFRHGQSNENHEGIRYGTGDDAYLTEFGLAQAEELADFLSDKKINIIYSSPTKRAINTAKIITNKYQELEIILNKNLAERVFGFWYNDNPETQKRVDETLVLVKEFFHTIPKELKNVAISSHGGITRALCYLLGVEANSIKNCECFHFIYKDNNWTLAHNFKPSINAENKSDI